LGIRYVGETTAKYLAEHFRTLDAIAVATLEELSEAEEVGAKIAESIVDYFASEQNKRIIERLREAGVQLEIKEKVRASNALEGKSVLVSGKFPGYSRDDMKAMVEQHGGRNLAAVSANVDFIVAGDNMGPAKRQKAEKLGITILSLEEFMALISDTPQTSSEVTAETEVKRVDETPVQGTLF
jgi:DNA ligase (NAD+)